MGRLGRAARRLRPRARGPVVVTGAPRSGTTYLRAILEQHPDVSLTNELRVFRWAHEVLHGAAEPRMHLRGPHRDVVLEEAAAALPDVVRGAYRRISPDARHWGDKNPFYAEDPAHLRTIVTLFPTARIVNLVRDGRDVAASLSRRRTPDGTPWSSLGDAADLWLRCVASAEEFATTAPPDTFLDLPYERLVADDVRVAEEVLDFLGIRMSPAVRDFCASQREQRTPVSQPTSDLDEAGESGRTTGWRSLPRPDRLLLLDRLAPVLVRRGYETAESLARLRVDTSSV